MHTRELERCRTLWGTAGMVFHYGCCGKPAGLSSFVFDTKTNDDYVGSLDRTPEIQVCRYCLGSTILKRIAIVSEQRVSLTQNRLKNFLCESFAACMKLFFIKNG